MPSNELEQKPEYSMGTTPMIPAIQRLIQSRDEMIDIICLNLGTLVRNCMPNESVKEALEHDKKLGVHTDQPGLALFNEAKAEMVKVVSDLCQMLNDSQYAMNPTLITYHSDYSKSIDRALYRPPAEGKYYQTFADDRVRTTLVKGSRKMMKQGGVSLIELPIRDKFLPWRHLMVEIEAIKNNHNVLMISNHPVDYHLGSVSHTFRIVRSYTAEVVKYKKLGSSVFGQDAIPFNIYTHPLFGDKEDIKPSLASGDRSKVIKVAEEEEWMLKTKDYIHDRLYQLGIKIPANF